MSYVELNSFLKAKGFGETGGQVKFLIRNAKVLVNGEVEVRNRRKLRAGYEVTAGGRSFIVMEEECRVEDGNDDIKLN